ncbi:uncharacterized protein DFL_005744 [Arthrobotrys flagrans]|uniref:Polyketide cyclase/dehydrase n=1 Tax=Arthrobotrys flagrans TaxID=97331 RepID=A0A436ZZ70_ARTFL|nr:hypothetical protein DFL_005744 [Arthrobotrys flagrans]
MSAKAVDQTRPSAAQIISPGQSTPSYPDGGYFSVKSAPVTINATKDQILTVLLRFSAYHTWNNFIPQVTDIVHPSETTPGLNESPRDPDLGVVGTSFTFQDIKDREYGYGTCKYEAWDTFQKSFGSVITRWVLAPAVKGGFNEWSADLKKAVEGHNW